MPYRETWDTIQGQWWNYITKVHQFTTYWNKKNLIQFEVLSPYICKDTCNSTLINGICTSTDLVGFDVLTAMVMKRYLWDITPSSLLRINRRFGGTCRLHLQGRKISQARNQHESSSLHNVLARLQVDFKRTTPRYIAEGWTLQVQINYFQLCGRRKYLRQSIFLLQYFQLTH
jgi:hypothetical protein